MSKIILSYSKYHFDPKINRIDGGTGFISSILWRELHATFPKDEILFLDYKEYKKILGVKDVKLFIGISPNFQNFVKKMNPDFSVLWGVNKSAKSRRDISKLAKNHKLPFKSLSEADGIFSNLQEIKYADSVVTFGGWSNYKSYVEAGLNPNAVFPIGMGNVGHSKYRKLSSGINILYFTGNINFRKGAHLINEILQYLKNNNLRIKLIVVGNTSSKYWLEEIDNYLFHFPENFTYINEWLNFDDSKWINLVDSCAFAIFPSFEEGVAAAPIDVIMSGLPVLYSNETGLEFTESAFNLTMETIEEWISAIHKMLGMSASGKNRMLLEQQNLLRLNGNEIPQIRNVLKRISLGNLWPQIELAKDLTKKYNLEKLPLISKSPEYIISDLGDILKLPNAHRLIIKNRTEVLDADAICRLGIITLDKYLPMCNLTVVSSDTSVQVQIDSVYNNWKSDSEYKKISNGELILIQLKNISIKRSINLYVIRKLIDFLRKTYLRISNKKISWGLFLLTKFNYFLNIFTKFIKN